MSLIGLVHLAEGLFNQTQGNQNDTSNKKTQNQPAARKPDANHEDEFRRSNASSANEAGLFQVRQQTIFSAAAAVLLVQGGAGQNQAAPETANATTNTATPAVPTAANTNTATTAAVTNAAVNTNASTTTTEDAQALSQLQSLNASLIALGLSQDEIDVVDRVAQLINDFSPAAFTSLVNQLQVLAQNSGQTAAAPATATTTANNTANGTTGNAQTGPGFSIQALSIKFAGVNETVQQNGKNGNGGTLQVSAFQLQVSEVNLTLGNAATGQTAQIQAPQSAAAPPGTGATTSTALTKAATA